MHKQEIIINNIFTSSEHNYFTRKKFDIGNSKTIGHSSVELKVGFGLANDRFEFSKYPITFFSLEVAQDVCSSLDIDLDIKLFRRNIIVSGVHLNSLIGKRFKIGSIEFEGLAHCAPCTWMNAVMKKGVYKAMIGRGGLRVKVLSAGKLNLGLTQLYTDFKLEKNPLIPLIRPKLP